MEKQEVLDRLEEIVDSMDSDFLNRQEIEAIVEDIKDLQWQLNANTKEF
jgi:exonuclease VII small subunit